MTTELETIANKINIKTPIVSAENAFALMGYITYNKIKVAENDHKELKALLELSPVLLEKTIKVLNDGYSEFVKNSDKNSSEYFSKMIELYEPSDKVKEEAYIREHIGRVKNEEKKVKDNGTVKKILSVTVPLAIGVMVKAITKPKKLWEK